MITAFGLESIWPVRQAGGSAYRRRYAGLVPAMVAAARWFCTTAPYRLLAGGCCCHGRCRAWTRPARHSRSAPAAVLWQRNCWLDTRDLTLTVTDYDAGMVTRAGKIVAAFPGRAAVQQVDAARLPFADDRFDVVLSFAMLHHVGDWQARCRGGGAGAAPGRTLRRLRRPGGAPDTAAARR